MKSRSFNSVAILFVSVLLCLSFASCKNFLNAGAIRDEIQEAIEIANSSAVTMYITVDEDSGSVVPAQIVKKKKESFEIKFTPQPNWKFLNWEVIDRTTGKVVQDAVRFQDPEKPETKATILKPNSNYQIHAKCVLLPAIVSVSPANLQSAPVNSPIYITFNMQMEDSAIKPSESIFKYGDENVSIYYGGDNMQSYFDAPSFFDSEKKVLVITPKSMALKEFIESELKVAYIDVTVSFGQNIAVQDGSSSLTLSKEAGNSVSVRYTSQREQTPPKEYEFCVTNGALSVEDGPVFFAAKKNHFNYECIYDGYGSPYKELMLENLTNGTIYIYGKYYDEGSGVRAVTVKEKLVNKHGVGVSVVADEYSHVYLFDSEGADFLRDYGGNTFFCIECKLLSGDGAVAIEVEVSDVAGNAAPKKKLVAIKKSVIDMNFTISNGPDINTIVDDTLPTNESPGHKATGENKLKEQLRTFIIEQAGLFPDYYPIGGLDDDYVRQNFEVKCRYGDNKIIDIPAEHDGLMLCWPFELDVESISGLEFTIIIKDSIGNSAEKTYKIPDYDSIIYYKEPSTDPQDPDYEFVYFLSKEKGVAVREGFYGERKDGKLYTNFISLGPSLNAYCVIEKDQTIQICPQVMDDDQTYCFYLDFNNELSISYGMSNGTLNDVSLKNDPQTNMPVKIEKTDELFYDIPALKVTVFIDDNSWQVNQYDCIYVSWDMEYYKKMFDYGKTSCSFLLRTEDLFRSDFPIVVYGIKDGKKTTGSTYEIPKLQGAQYDNVKPKELGIGENFERTSWDTFTFTIADNESGLKSGEVKLKGFKESIFPENNGNEIIIPIRNPQRVYYHDDSTGMDYWRDYLYFDYWIYDNANNCQYEKIESIDVPITYVPVVKELNINTTDKTFTLKSEDYSRYETEPNAFDFYELTDSGADGYKWTLLESKTNTVTASTAHGGYYESVFSTDSNDTSASNYFDLPEDAFIRIIPKYGSAYGTPTYFYTGAKSFDKSDIIQPHTANSVLIQSEQPAYVHTVVTTASYEECSKWDSQKWEYYNEYLGDDYLDFKNHPGLLEYTIPVDKIGSDRRYVVIAHFSSGKAVVSEVYSTPAE